MNTTSPDSAGNYRPHTLGEFAELTPEEVGRRFLNLIESLKSFDELSSDRVREVTQLPMVIPPSDTDDGFLTMSLPESGWQYSFSYSINAQYPRYTNAAIEFSNIKDDRADMAAVCGIDFNAYVSELKRMGFLEREDMAQYDTVPPLPVYIDGDVNGRVEWSQAQFRRIPTYFFSRGNVIVSIRQQREADAPDAKLYHACVESIGISRAGG
ncbi:MAG TPA: hypothetical protein VF471_03045 [Pseudoxanthomonas sp.]